MRLCQRAAGLIWSDLCQEVAPSSVTGPVDIATCRIARSRVLLFVPVIVYPPGAGNPSGILSDLPFPPYQSEDAVQGAPSLCLARENLEDSHAYTLWEGWVRQEFAIPGHSMVVAALAAIALLAAPSAAQAQQTIKIDNYQVATVSGSWGSLQSLVEDLCFRAGIELRAYDAPDRPIAAHYHDVALAELLRRLLARESFVLTLRSAGGAPGSRVTSLRVIGDTETARGNRRRPSPFHKAQRPWQPPPSLLGSAFGETPDDDRQTALQQLTEGILTNKADLEGFLATDPAQMAEALQRYPNAAVMLRSLRGEKSGKLSPQIAEKLDLVIKALEDHRAYVIGNPLPRSPLTQTRHRLPGPSFQSLHHRPPRSESAYENRRSQP